MNQNYGSAVWSKVLTGILAIEAELKWKRKTIILNPSP
jgi:hypothetical protein